MSRLSTTVMRTDRDQIEQALVRTAYFSAKPKGLAGLLRPVGALRPGGSCYFSPGRSVYEESRWTEY